MLHTIKRTLFVGGTVAVVAALCSGAALAARGHGQLGPRAMHGTMGGFGPFAMTGPGFGLRMGGMGGPGMGLPGFGMRGHGPGHPGGPGGGILATEVLKTASTFLGISVTELGNELKSGKTLAEIATAKGKKPADLITALTNAAKTNLDAAVAAGWITQKQADAVLEGLTKAVTELVNDGPPVPRIKHAGPLNAAATYLGMSVEDLFTALKGGKTLAQVAADKGKTVDGLVSALTADAKAKLDKAVTAGDITQAQANALMTKLTERVTDMVNGVHGPRATKTTSNTIKHTVRFVVRR
jgi:hypothetical protein